MAQEATGSAATEANDPAEATTAVTEKTDEARMRKPRRWSIAFAMVRSRWTDPVADSLSPPAAVGGVQLVMLRRLSEIYGVVHPKTRQVHHCEFRWLLSFRPAPPRPLQ